MTTPLHFRCPPDVLEAIDARAKADNVGRSAVIIKAIRAGLGLVVTPSDDTRLPARVAQVEAQLAALIAQVAEIKAAPVDTTPTPVLDPVDQAAMRDAVNQLDGPEPQPPNVVDGQMSFLDALPEQGSDAESAQALDTQDDWMHVKEGFRLAGGDPADTSSTIPALDNSGKTYKLATFRLVARNIEPFGFERHPENGAMVRPVHPVLLQRLAAKRNAEG